jgi:hypothetical protein
MPSKLLLPETVSDRIGLAVSTLAKMRLRGDGPPYKRIGGRVMYPEDLLDHWIDAQPVQHSTAEGSARRKGAGRKKATAQSAA